MPPNLDDENKRVIDRFNSIIESFIRPGEKGAVVSSEFRSHIAIKLRNLFSEPFFPKIKLLKTIQQQSSERENREIAVFELKNEDVSIISMFHYSGNKFLGILFKLKNSSERLSSEALYIFLLQKESVEQTGPLYYPAFGKYIYNIGEIELDGVYYLIYANESTFNDSEF